MFSIKLIVGFAVLAGVYAEPPRKRFNFRFGARQEAAVDDAATADNLPASQGYNYEAPKERLSLPIKFRQFARQEDASSGYSYPKPTNGYGVPGEDESTDAPTTEYGAPETTDSSEDTATDNPAAESLRGVQAANLRRKNAKLSRNPSARLISGDVQFQKQVQPVVFTTQAQPVVFQQQAQPFYYVEYPTAEYVEPQYYYVFKK